MTDACLHQSKYRNVIAAFIYAEYLSLAMAKVWAGKADLRGTTELWRRYDKVVKDRGGYGKHFQFLGAEGTKAALRFFQGWLNADAIKYGGRQIDGFPDTSEIEAIWTKAQFFGPDSIASIFTDGTESWAQDIVFSDNL